MIIKPGIYQHYKNKQHYLVVGVAVSSENGRDGLQMVVYQALYPTHGAVARLFTRPVDEFQEEVLWVEEYRHERDSSMDCDTARKDPRFKLVCEVDQFCLQP